MTNEPIKSLFANDIYRRIEEVIKVDQTTDDILRDEINEYVVTDAIRSHYTNIFDAYRETPNKPHEGIAIWVSGFFGSGKSSFAGSGEHFRFEPLEFGFAGFVNFFWSGPGGGEPPDENGVGFLATRSAADAVGLAGVRRVRLLHIFLQLAPSGKKFGVV